MTAIANVGLTDESIPLFSVTTIKEGPGSQGQMPSGIFCLGFLTAPDNQILYLSLVGRDTALQEMRGLLTAGKLNSFLIHQDGKQVGGWFSHAWLGQMEYHGAKLPTHLFGELTQMILYHPLMTTPDKSARTAVLPFLGMGGLAQTQQDAWQLVKHLSDIPLLDAWHPVVKDLLVSLQWWESLQGFNSNAYYIRLGSNLAGLISANIRSGALRVEPDEAGRYAIPDNATLDLEHGLAERYQPEASATGRDDWEIISVHTRQMLIDDGDLVDVTRMSEVREAGFKVPVALTRAVWNRFVEWDDADVSKAQESLGQSTKGRLWDVMWMAFLAIRNSRQGGDVLFYEVYVIERDGYSTTPRSVKLKLHSGAGDNGEHVITIMLPGEG